jgi:hypothetical protein
MTYGHDIRAREQASHVQAKFACFVKSEMEGSQSKGLNGDDLVSNPPRREISRWHDGPLGCGGSDGRCEQGNKIASEPQEGNVEYKLMLVDPTEERLTHLTTQLKWRVAEGQGEAIYAIGVEVRG